MGEHFISRNSVRDLGRIQEIHLKHSSFLSAVTARKKLLVVACWRQEGLAGVYLFIYLIGSVASPTATRTLLKIF